MSVIITQQIDYLYPDRVRLPLDFDAAALVADLTALAGVVWTEHVARGNYEGDWSILPLRAAAGETHPIRQAMPIHGATAWVDLPVLDHLPACRAVLAAIGCPLQTVRLMRLTPGSAILEHADPDLSAEDGIARLHVPITTNPDITFLLNGTPVPMAPGELWYVRLSDRHAVTNHGTTDRIHLVIDVTATPWLTDMLGE